MNGEDWFLVIGTALACACTVCTVAIVVLRNRGQS